MGGLGLLCGVDGGGVARYYGTWDTRMISLRSWRWGNLGGGALTNAVRWLDAVEVHWGGAVAVAEVGGQNGVKGV